MCFSSLRMLTFSRLSTFRTRMLDGLFFVRYYYYCATCHSIIQPPDHSIDPPYPSTNLVRNSCRLEEPTHALPRTWPCYGSVQFSKGNEVHHRVLQQGQGPHTALRLLRCLCPGEPCLKECIIRQGTRCISFTFHSRGAAENMPLWHIASSPCRGRSSRNRD